MRRLAAVLVLAAVVAACSTESSTWVGVSGVEFRMLTKADLRSVSEWCAADAECGRMSQDDATFYFEGIAHRVCEPSEKYPDLIVKPPDELRETLGLDNLLLPESYVGDIVGITMTACPDMAVLVGIALK